MIEIDESKYPIVVVTYQSDTEEGVASFVKKMEKFYQRGTFYLIADTSQIEISEATAMKRQILGKGLRDLSTRYPLRKLSEAIVVRNNLQKNLLTAVNWIRGKGDYKQKIFSTMREAVDWTTEQIRATK